MFKKDPIRLIDLFCGAGGMTRGFEIALKERFMPVWANDNNKDAVAAYNSNFGYHCMTGDLVEILDRSAVRIPAADIVIGGPPCQGFSLLNRNREHDPRKQLWRPFLDVVGFSDAGIFVMENVPQLLDSLEYDEIEKESEKLGFTLAPALLRAADYGVPQRRYRAFIVGCKFADPNDFFPPKRTHVSPDKNARSNFKISGEIVKRPRPWRTVRDVIGDLPSPTGTDIRDVKPPLNLHFGRSPTELSLMRYRIVSEEGMNRFDLQRLAPELTPDCWIRKVSGGTDLFGRLWWDKPSFTIRTEFYKPEKGRYLHPSEHRPITHREAARLQSFPDSHIFYGKKIEIAKQIGNAVPPLLAAAVAKCVMQIWEQQEIGAKATSA